LLSDVENAMYKNNVGAFKRSRTKIVEAIREHMASLTDHLYDHDARKGVRDKRRGNSNSEASDGGARIPYAPLDNAYYRRIAISPRYYSDVP
jgi:hypothetical protein